MLAFRFKVRVLTPAPYRPFTKLSISCLARPVECGLKQRDKRSAAVGMIQALYHIQYRTKPYIPSYCNYLLRTTDPECHLTTYHLTNKSPHIRDQSRANNPTLTPDRPSRAINHGPLRRYSVKTNVLDRKNSTAKRMTRKVRKEAWWTWRRGGPGENTPNRCGTRRIRDWT